MIDDAQRAQFDQELARFRDLWCDSLHSFYDGCIEAGFDDKQAMRLTELWLTAWLKIADKVKDE